VRLNLSQRAWKEKDANTRTRTTNLFIISTSHFDPSEDASQIVEILTRDRRRANRRLAAYSRGRFRQSFSILEISHQEEQSYRNADFLRLRVWLVPYLLAARLTPGSTFSGVVPSSFWSRPFEIARTVVVYSLSIVTTYFRRSNVFLPQPDLSLFLFGDPYFRQVAMSIHWLAQALHNEFFGTQNKNIKILDGISIVYTFCILFVVVSSVPTCRDRLQSSRERTGGQP
jgi:hypothetical protein